MDLFYLRSVATTFTTTFFGRNDRLIIRIDLRFLPYTTTRQRFRELNDFCIHGIDHSADRRFFRLIFIDQLFESKKNVNKMDSDCRKLFFFVFEAFR